MTRRNVRITAVRRDPPALDTFVAALLAFYIDRLEAEKRQRAVTRGKVKLLPPASSSDR